MANVPFIHAEQMFLYYSTNINKKQNWLDKTDKTD